MDVSRQQAEATRLLPLVRRVLERYPFAIHDVTYLATHSNVLYRLTSDNRQEMVLRVGTPHANHRSNIEIEISWLDAIWRDTNLDVVRPIRTADGELIVDEFDEHIEKERSCVVFSWIPGQPMGTSSGPFAYRLLGTMCAALQAHGRSWTPPESAALRIWDQVFYYEENFDPIVITDPVFGHLFDNSRLKTIRKAFALSQTVTDESYAEFSPQVVHGDLHEWNVHLAGAGKLYAFDFEDVMLALPAQDVSVCLYSSRSSEIRSDIRSSFRRGYESVTPWPVVDERQLDAFHAARQIMLMNYAARTLPVREAAEFLDYVMPWLDRYVRHYG